MREVVVTGYGAVSPAGLGVRALWQQALQGRALGGPIADWDVSRNRSRIGCRIDAAELSRLIGSSDVDPYVSYATAAAEEAWTAAGLGGGDFDRCRAGVCIGTAVGGVISMEKAYRASVRVSDNGTKAVYPPINPPAVPPTALRNFMASTANVAVARALGLQGICLCPSTGCTAGLDAIGIAFDAIRMGLADLIVTGASEAPFSPIVLTAFDNIHCLTTRNDDPRSASRPFDEGRDGFLLAEGAGILVLEAANFAKRRDAPIRGRVLGYASGSSAYHMTGLASDGRHQARVISLALERSRLHAADISYFNLHGTSTPQNDISETAAMKTALGAAAHRIPMSSTKSVIGHALGAASALASIVCLCAMHSDVVPPTANLDHPGLGCDLDYVPQVARDRELKIVGINASGFSGIHTTAFYARS